VKRGLLGVGEWTHDQFNGAGTLTDLRSCSTFKGGFKRGHKHGSGEESYHLRDTSVATEILD
jgi:hypothetical protein